MIQVFTRRGGGAPAFNGSASYGTYGTSQATAGVGGAQGAWRYAIQGGYQGSRGFNAIANPADFSFNPDRDGYDRGNASANLSYRFNADHDIAAQYYYSRLSNRFDATANFDDKTTTTVESFALSSTDRLATFWVSRLSIGQGSDDSVSQSGFGNSGFGRAQNQLTWQNDLDAAGRHAVARLRRARRANQHRSRFSGDIAADKFGRWRLPAACRPAHAAAQRPL